MTDRSTMWPKNQLIGLLLTLLLIAPLALCDVAMVFSVQRHGARNVLKKTPFLVDSDAFGGPSLLPDGQRQCYNAGQTYLARYINTTTCATAPVSTCLLRWAPSGSTNGNNYGLLNSTAAGFNNFNVLFTSSALDRTLQSAQSFLAGVFPAMPRNSTTQYLPSGQQVVPVYTVNDVNDNHIRAYTKCPAYDAVLSSWYSSAEFHAKEAESAPLRANVSKLYPSFDTSLANWWNVYDPFNVWNKYQVGDNLTVSKDLLADMTTLAYWLEVTKMRSNMTGSLLGGTMLQLLSQWLQAAATVLTAPPGSSVDLSMYQLVGYSAHYNTQLGLLAALRLDQYPAAIAALTTNKASWLATGMIQTPGVIPKLPGTAAVIAFELHAPSSASTPGNLAATSSLAVRLVVKDGPDTTFTYVPVPLPCQTHDANGLGGPEACTLPDFLKYISNLTLDSDGAWCEACQNSNMTACVALGQDSAPAGDGCSSGHANWEIAVAVVVSVVGTALLAVACVALWVWRQKQRKLAKDQKLSSSAVHIEL